MLKQLLIALAFLAAGSAGAQAPGADYTTLSPPVATDSTTKVEVIEFFWYGCPHCFALEPIIEPWVKKQPGDVEFKRVPAIFNEQWAIAGRVYYTLEALGLLDRLHKPLFDAIHKDGLRITNAKALAEWLEKNGVDAKKFNDTEKSFAVEGRMKRATALTQSSRIDGVPALMINGKYIVPAGEKMLLTADTLIAQSRKELAAAGPAKK